MSQTKLKYFFAIIIAMSAIAMAVLVSITFPIALQSHISCPESVNGACTILGHFPTETFVGITALAIMMAAGAYMLIVSRRTEGVAAMKYSSQVEHVKNLGEEEKKIYDLVAASDGTAFQNELIEKSGFSKVKISRLLDRLETKGIVERRRRGMANLIVLKRNYS